MTRQELTNKPLVEAIFELRWEIGDASQESGPDPFFPVLTGSLYKNLETDYPIIERLPAALMPPLAAGHLVQFRFRQSENGWPLVQVGPGILTLNATDDYHWPAFRDRIQKLIDALLRNHPKREDLRPTKIELRYINAVEIEGVEATSFTRDMLKVNVELNQKLVSDNRITGSTDGFDLRFSFKSPHLGGAVQLRFVQGQKAGKDAVIWETIIQNSSNLQPTAPFILSWTEDAHNLAEDWFFATIEGTLERRFK